MSSRMRRLGVEKFVDRPCRACGTPSVVINGRWLRLQRETAGLTLREMGLRMHFSAMYICDIEHNRRHCSPLIRAAYEALRS